MCAAMMSFKEQISDAERGEICGFGRESVAKTDLVPEMRVFIPSHSVTYVKQCEELCVNLYLLRGVILLKS